MPSTSNRLFRALRCTLPFALGVVAGCGSSGGAAVTSTTVPRLVLDPAVTQQLPPGTGQLWPMDETTTVAPVTTPASTTGREGAPAGDANVEAVRAQVGLAESALSEALADPGSDQSQTLIESVTASGSPARAEFENLTRSVAAAGLARVPNDAAASSVAIESGPTLVTFELALVTVCDVTAYKAYLEDQNGNTSWLEPTVTAARYVETFQLLSGAWTLVERQQLAVYEGSPSCAA